MDEKARDKTISNLAATMRMTRTEIDGIRMVLQAAVMTLSTQPQLVPVFKAMLQHVQEADTAITLASPMSEAMLKERADWVTRLLPQNMR